MKNIFIIAACTLILCSCSTEIPDNPVTDNEMRFSVEYPLSRATDSAFESGDLMGVFATEYSEGEALPLQVSGNIGNNAPYTFNGAVWESDKPIYWGDENVDVYAYYPYMAISSIDENPFSVALDQSTSETDDALSGYEASDFLWAMSENISQSETTQLTFEHRLSKVAIHLLKGDEYEGNLPEAGEVYIHNVVADATIDFTSGFVTKSTYGESVSIKARQVSAELYEAIIIPQRVDSNIPIFELVIEGVSFLVESKFVFQMGTQHNVYLTLDSDPNKIKIEIGGDIDGGWN